LDQIVNVERRSRLRAHRADFDHYQVFLEVAWKAVGDRPGHWGGTGLRELEPVQIDIGAISPGDPQASIALFKLYRGLGGNDLSLKTAGVINIDRPHGLPIDGKFWGSRRKRCCDTRAQIKATVFG